jgi:hypothetical protein
MARWGDLRGARPDLAQAGWDLLYQHGVGLALLSTVRLDGGPRLHPMCPLFHDDGLYAFLVLSLKRGDLLRDGRYAMHCYPPPDNEDAFYLTGTANLLNGEETVAALSRRFLDERSQLSLTEDDLADQLAFEFDIDTCLLTRTDGHGDPNPRHEVWKP